MVAVAARADVAVSRRGLMVWPILVVAAALGPYVVPAAGLRTEQLAVYGLAVIAVFCLLLRPYIHPAVLVPLLAWGGYLGVLVISALFRPDVPGIEQGSLFAGLDNVALPVAALLVANLWLTSPHADARRVARSLATGIVALMAANGLLAVISWQVDLTPVLSRFWSGDVTGTAVAVLAAGQNRFSGVFNQPAEAGVAYSIALLCAIYLFVGLRSRPIALAVFGGLIAVGGFLTVSKIFLLVGLPLAVFQMVRFGAWRPRQVAAWLLAGVSLWTASAAGWISFGWFPAGSLSRLQTAVAPGVSGPGLVSAYTAGRFGAQGSVVSVGHLVMRLSPTFGFGVAGLPDTRDPFDSAWLAALIIGGVLGVIALALVFATLVLLWRRYRGRMPVPDRRLSGAVLCVLLAASLGLPDLTSNREGTLVWLLLPVLLATRQPG